jgi:hypothetical protein
MTSVNFFDFSEYAASEKDRLHRYCEGIGRTLRQSLIYSTGMTQEKMQPAWALECCNFQFMGRLCAEHDPILPHSCPHPDWTRCQFLDIADRSDDVRPIDDIDTIAKAAVGLAATVLATSICMVLPSDQN